MSQNVPECPTMSQLRGGENDPNIEPGRGEGREAEPDASPDGTRQFPKNRRGRSRVRGPEIVPGNLQAQTSDLKLFPKLPKP